MKLFVGRKRKRKCPRCNVALRAVDLRGVEVDACPRCYGAWFDPFEIQSFLRKPRELQEYVPAADRAWSDSELHCPACNGTMRRLKASEMFPFDIDICGECKGYWFDRDELDRAAETFSKKWGKFKTQDIADLEKRKHAVVQHQVERIEKAAAPKHYPQEEAAPVGGASFFDDLSAPQKLVALLGLPVESGRFYAWRSWVNLVLILANISVFVFMLFKSHWLRGLMGDFPRDWFATYGFVPSSVAAEPQTKWHTVLTAMFFHAGLVHLAGNMFFLFTTGDDVEKRLGHFLYLPLFLLGGVVASLLSLATGVSPSIPHVGASGAVAGVMGAYMALCRHKSFFLWVFRISLFGKMMALSAWLYLLLWFGTQLLSLKFGNPGIDYWAHIGGFVFGYVVAKIVAARQEFNLDTGMWEWKKRR